MSDCGLVAFTLEHWLKFVASRSATIQEVTIVKVVTRWPSKLIKVFWVILCITTGDLRCDVSMAAENSAAADIEKEKVKREFERVKAEEFNIHRKPRRSRISDFEKKRRISAIIDANPAIKASIQDLVDHDPVGSDDDKTNRAIFALYIKNTVFREAVDKELER